MQFLVESAHLVWAWTFVWCEPLWCSADNNVLRHGGVRSALLPGAACAAGGARDSVGAGDERAGEYDSGVAAGIFARTNDHDSSTANTSAGDTDDCDTSRNATELSTWRDDARSRCTAAKFHSAAGRHDSDATGSSGDTGREFSDRAHAARRICSGGVRDGDELRPAG